MCTSLISEVRRVIVVPVFKRGVAFHLSEHKMYDSYLRKEETGTREQTSEREL